MDDTQKLYELNRLISFLESEKRYLTSCVPDLVSRIQKAIDEHLEENMENPVRWDIRW